jgi:hypothetical protein
MPTTAEPDRLSVFYIKLLLLFEFPSHIPLELLILAAPVQINQIVYTELYTVQIKKTNKTNQTYRWRKNMRAVMRIGAMLAEI